MKSFQNHPDFPTVQKIYHVLQDKGFQVLLVGGCVRDGLMGVLPRDFDLATNATPTEVEKIFPKTIAVGKAFGVILVVENGIQIEVATFRSDGVYQDGRRPQSIVFSSPNEDAMRRDFTANALFYDLGTDTVIDYVGGEVDIKNKIIRAVGDVKQRFKEDHLRMLRAIRFVGQLGFSIEPETWKSILMHADLVETVSGERLHEEIEKLLSSKYAKNALSLLVESKILTSLFPQVVFAFANWPQTPDSKGHDWIGFWTWVWKCSEGKLKRSQMSNYIQKWRFSKKDRDSIERALSWYIDAEHFSKSTDGEIIEKIFAEGYFTGLQYFISDYPMHQNRFKQIMLKKEALGEHLPEPILRATDLEVQLKGARLGEALKKVYWAQLEGVIKSKEQGLAFLSSQRLGNS